MSRISRKSLLSDLVMISKVVKFSCSSSMIRLHPITSFKNQKEDLNVKKHQNVNNLTPTNSIQSSWNKRSLEQIRKRPLLSNSNAVIARLLFRNQFPLVAMYQKLILECNQTTRIRWRSTERELNTAKILALQKIGSGIPLGSSPQTTASLSLASRKYSCQVKNLIQMK